MTTLDGGVAAPRQLEYARVPVAGGMPALVQGIGIASICVGSIGVLASLVSLVFAARVFVLSTPPKPPPAVAPLPPPVLPKVSVAPYGDDYYGPAGLGRAERRAALKALNMSCAMEPLEDQAADRLLSDFGSLVFPHDKRLTTDAALTQIRASGRGTGQPVQPGRAVPRDAVGYAIASGHLTLFRYTATFEPADGSASAHAEGAVTWRGDDPPRYASGALDDWMQTAQWRLNGRVNPVQAQAALDKVAASHVDPKQRAAVPYRFGARDGNSARYLGRTLLLQDGAWSAWVLPDGHLVPPAPQLDPQTGLPAPPPPPAPPPGPRLPVSHAAATMTLVEPVVALAIAVFLIVAGARTLMRSRNGDLLHAAYLWVKIPAILLAITANAWLLWSASRAPAGSAVARSGALLPVGLGILVQAAYPIALLFLLRTRSVRSYFGIVLVAMLCLPGLARCGETNSEAGTPNEEQSLRRQLLDSAADRRELERLGHAISRRPESQILLLQLMRDPDVNVRRVAVRASLDALPPTADMRAPARLQAPFDATAPVLIDMLSDADPQASFAAGVLLAGYPAPGELLPQFRAALSKVPGRSAALLIRAAAHCRADNDQIVSFLVEALSHPSTSLEAVSALGKLTYRGKPAIVLAFQSPDVRVRQAAVRMLRSTKADDGIADALGEALGDSDAQVRNDASIGLRGQGARGMEILLRALNSSNAAVRTAAVGGLGAPEHTPIVGILVKQAGESDPVRRARAMASLGAAGTLTRYRPIILRALLAGLSDRDPAVRDAAAEAVVGVRRTLGDCFRESNLNEAELGAIEESARSSKRPALLAAARAIASPARIGLRMTPPVAPPPTPATRPPGGAVVAAFDGAGWYAASAAAWAILGIGFVLGVLMLRRQLARRRVVPPPMHFVTAVDAAGLPIAAATTFPSSPAIQV